MFLFLDFINRFVSLLKAKCGVIPEIIPISGHFRYHKMEYVCECQDFPLSSFKGLYLNDGENCISTSLEVVRNVTRRFMSNTLF